MSQTPNPIKRRLFQVCRIKMIKNTVELAFIGKTQAPKIRKVQASDTGKASLENWKKCFFVLGAALLKFLGFSGFGKEHASKLDLKGVKNVC